MFRSLCCIWQVEPSKSFKATGAMMCKPPVSSSFIIDLRLKPCSSSTTRACSITQHGVGPQVGRKLFKDQQNRPPKYIKRHQRTLPSSFRTFRSFPPLWSGLSGASVPIGEDTYVVAFPRLKDPLRLLTASPANK